MIGFVVRAPSRFVNENVEVGLVDDDLWICVYKQYKIMMSRNWGFLFGSESSTKSNEPWSKERLMHD